MNYVPDAERILERPTQFLYGDKFVIKIRPGKSSAPSMHAVCLHADDRINPRMVKKSLQGYGIMSCNMMGDSKCDAIVVFQKAEGMQRAGSNICWVV